MNRVPEKTSKGDYEIVYKSLVIRSIIEFWDPNRSKHIQALNEELIEAEFILKTSNFGSSSRFATQT